MDSTVFKGISEQFDSAMFKTISQQIGLPEALQSTLSLTIEDNPWNSGLFKALVQNTNGTPRDGCNNSAFSVFGFLAFLLAAANLFMMERRKKRDVTTDNSVCGINGNQKNETILASYSMLRGFLNALDAHDQVCSNYFMCQAAFNASKMGDIGLNLAKIASSNADSWLNGINATLHQGTKIAGLHGTNKNLTEENGCEQSFPCKRFHKMYKNQKLVP